MAHYTIPLSDKLHWREKKILSSYLKSTSLFEVQTRKNEGLFFQGLHSIWQQFGSIVYFGPSMWSMIDDRGENHEPLAWAQTCKLLSADCRILLDIYQVDYSTPLYLQKGSCWSIPPQEGERWADAFPARWKYKPLQSPASISNLVFLKCILFTRMSQHYPKIRTKSKTILLTTSVRSIHTCSTYEAIISFSANSTCWMHLFFWSQPTDGIIRLFSGWRWVDIEPIWHLVSCVSR